MHGSLCSVIARVAAALGVTVVVGAAAGSSAAAPMRAGADGTVSVRAAAVASKRSHTKWTFTKQELSRFSGSFSKSVPIFDVSGVPGQPRIVTQVGTLTVRDDRRLSDKNRVIIDTITLVVRDGKLLIPVTGVLVRGAIECGHPQKCGALPHEPGTRLSNRFTLHLRQGVPETTTTFIYSPGRVNRRFRSLLKFSWKYAIREVAYQKLRWSVPRGIGFPVPVRCDSGGFGAKLRGKGCVYPTVMPVFQPHKENGWVWANVSAGLTRVPGWAYLKRTPYKTAAARHRSVTRYWCRQLEKIDKKPKRYDCDEFPFATATPANKRLKPNKRNRPTQVAFVPREQNRSEGGYLRWFFEHERIFAREEFKVVA